jgi:hypothetical protein
MNQTLNIIYRRVWTDELNSSRRTITTNWVHPKLMGSPVRHGRRPQRGTAPDPAMGEVTTAASRNISRERKRVHRRYEIGDRFHAQSKPDQPPAWDPSEGSTHEDEGLQRSRTLRFWLEARALVVVGSSQRSLMYWYIAPSFGGSKGYDSLETRRGLGDFSWGFYLCTIMIKAPDLCTIEKSFRIYIPSFKCNLSSIPLRLFFTLTPLNWLEKTSLPLRP